MKLVVQSPWTNVECITSLVKNGMFVFTPRMRNSCRERSTRRAASGNCRAHAVTFTSNES